MTTAAYIVAVFYIFTQSEKTLRIFYKNKLEKEEYYEYTNKRIRFLRHLF